MDLRRFICLYQNWLGIVNTYWSCVLRWSKWGEEKKTIHQLTQDDRKVKTNSAKALPKMQIHGLLSLLKMLTKPTTLRKRHERSKNAYSHDWSTRLHQQSNTKPGLKGVYYTKDRPCMYQTERSGLFKLTRHHKSCSVLCCKNPNETRQKPELDKITLKFTGTEQIPCLVQKNFLKVACHATHTNLGPLKDDLEAKQRKLSCMQQDWQPLVNGQDRVEWGANSPFEPAHTGHQAGHAVESHGIIGDLQVQMPPQEISGCVQTSWGNVDR